MNAAKRTSLERLNALPKLVKRYDEYFMNKKISESLEEANHNYDRLREALKKSLLNFTKTKKPNAYRNFI